MAGSEGQGSRSYMSDQMDSVVLDQADDAGGRNLGKSVLHAADPLSSSLAQSALTGFAGEEDLVEPPSYADAIFAPPYMGSSSDTEITAATNGPSPSEAQPSTSRPNQLVLNISVTDPQKIIESAGSSLVPGSGTYVSYKVTTKTNLPGYKASEFAVRRRFKDFVVLADRLAESYRGYFIPPRPDKAVVEGQVMQQKDFVEMRKMALDKYLKRLAAHPVLRNSTDLKVFLETEGRLPLQPTTDLASRMLDGAVKLPRQLFGSEQTTPPPQEAAQPAKGGRDLVRIFKELKQTVQNDWGSSKPPIAEEDKAYLDRKEKELDLEKQLLDASAKAEALTKAQQELGEVTGELGLAFVKIAKFEEEPGTSQQQKVHAVESRRLGHAAIRTSRLCRTATAQTVNQLGQLHEYLGLMAAIHAAMADRNNALVTVQTLTNDLATKKSKIEKLEAQSSKIFGGDTSRTRKIADLNREVAATDEALLAAKQEYEKIKERNREEIERFDRERHADFHQMLAGFVRTQVAYNEKAASFWQALADDSTQGRSARSSIAGT
ncbi:Sorting nexins and related PX domain-containing proteins [Klebsormidium nitens]|uniref:Sorting nexins and related PX domain-containing proteins n=1 Tax=Klebsormidium nitens TaxID=105231 RepID=A0A1Y1HV43_KLENI|nr:Sorting nexins and related PX domain-containing proteins [Klebsormidium nitens]|eukprot:GAQ79708.1 Sorting nexins and related PX domain-containing proteins [Klebsormidium nitens]